MRRKAQALDNVAVQWLCNKLNQCWLFGDRHEGGQRRDWRSSRPRVQRMAHRPDPACRVTSITPISASSK